MKRAALVSVGTLTGVIAVLSYAPSAVVTTADPEIAGLGSLTSPAPDDTLDQVDPGLGAEDLDPAPVEAPPSTDPATPTTPSDRARPDAATRAPVPPPAPTQPRPTRSPTPTRTPTRPPARPTTPRPTRTPTRKPAPTQDPTPTPSPTPTPTKKPVGATGTFTGNSVNTPFGPMQVAVVLRAGQIVDVSAITYPDRDPKSKELAGRAVPLMRQEVLKTQSTEVSAVSGASYTCKAFLDSLQSALSKAGRRA